jgi:hypothetical protein
VAEAHKLPVYPAAARLHRVALFNNNKHLPDYEIYNYGSFDRFNKLLIEATRCNRAVALFRICLIIGNGWLGFANLFQDVTRPEFCLQFF